MSIALCQRCGASVSAWTIRPAGFHVGRIEHWTLQLCRECTETIEAAVAGALKPFARICVPPPTKEDGR